MTTETKLTDFDAPTRPDPEVETTETTLTTGAVRRTCTGVQRMNPLASAAEPRD